MSTRYSVIVYQWLNIVQFWLLPPTCIVCMGSVNQHRDLCHICEETLTRIKRPCRSCGLPLPPGDYQSSACGTCLEFPPLYRRLLALYAYKPPVSSLVAACKYNGKLVNGRVLSQQLGTYLTSQYQIDELPVLLVPMPLHSARLRKRGFNQAIEIARTLASELSIPINTSLVKRTKNTEQQTGLNAKERAMNVKGAFSISPSFRFKANSTIAIIDDVVTTGSTAAELAKLLLKAGAREVHVWALARTVV